MNEKYVVNLRDVAIYHADNPFGSCSEKKLLQRGEMVLSEVNLSVAPGEFVYLIGRVGSGKSSLLKTLYAEMQLLTGKGYVAGFDLRRLRRKDIPYLRRRIGIVFQDYQLLTDRNVFMNLYYVMKATGWKREQEIRERIDRVLGLERLKAIHLNDSMNPLGAHKDRHAKIGEGCIGTAALSAVTNHPLLQGLPFCLETPNDLSGYAAEIALLRDLHRD
mgnify:CR=1 FL=1